MGATVKIGQAYGIPVMKFTLTYRGELHSGRDPQRMWAIRKDLAPQLEELWRITPSLVTVMEMRHIPKDGFFKLERHHLHRSEKPPVGTAPRQPSDIDLCAPIERGGYQFMPLVRDSLALRCGLSILFMRKEEPGKVYQGGDLDNRIKTLLDALSVPPKDQIIAGQEAQGPIYTLLEDDRLVSALHVETRQLLSEPNAPKHMVNLVIEVDVRVVEARLYNQPFLGD